jgi:hypothetical protein
MTLSGVSSRVTPLAAIFQSLGFLRHRRAAVFGNKHQRPRSMESKGWI